MATNGALVAVLGGLAVGGALYWMSKRKSGDSACVQALVAQGVPAELAPMACGVLGDPVGTVAAVQGAIAGALGKVNSLVGFGIGGPGVDETKCPNGDGCPDGMVREYTGGNDTFGMSLFDHRSTSLQQNGSYSQNGAVCVDIKTKAVKGTIDDGCVFHPWTAPATSTPPPVSPIHQPGTTVSLTGTRDHRH